MHSQRSLSRLAVRAIFRILNLSLVSVMNCRIQRYAVRGGGLVKIVQSLG